MESPMMTIRSKSNIIVYIARSKSIGPVECEAKINLDIKDHMMVVNEETGKFVVVKMVLD